MLKPFLIFGIFMTCEVAAFGQQARSDYQQVVRPRSSLWRTIEPSRNNIITYHHYLRFYPDGTVIGVSTTASPNELRRWFRFSYENRGKYSISGSEVQFSLASPGGQVDYEGTINGSQLILNFFSHINGNRDKEIYRWIRPRPERGQKSNRRLRRQILKPRVQAEGRNPRW
jgi:hypothetical protein